MKEETVGNDDNLKIVKEIGEEDGSINDLKKIYPDEIGKLEREIYSHISGNELKIIKAEYPDKLKYLKQKLAYPYEDLNCLEEIRKPINDLKNVNFFSKVENKYSDDKEIERTKGIIKFLNVKSGEASTNSYLKFDVTLVTYVFEKFTKV